MNYSEEVKKIVLASGLSDDDKKLVVGRLSQIDTKIAELLYKSIQAEPSALNFLVKSLKDKIAAQGNVRELEKIEQRENEEVLRILK